MKRTGCFFQSVVVVFVTMIFSSCQSPTIEQQVEKLMKTANAEKREKIAYTLAESLEPRAVDLIAGFYGNNQYATQALGDMLTRYKEMGENSKAFECIGHIQTDR
jgi:aspartate carbamoyltransferase catalytic subunit